VSVEADADRAAAAASVFHDQRHVTVLHDDWRRLLDHGPFDVLVLDGGGAGKASDDLVEVEQVLAPGGTVVIDDFTPCTTWPPTYLGDVDHARLRWLEHPALLATELVLAPDLASIVATRLRR
jgi:predicted O-methyltransferase YrrM